MRALSINSNPGDPALPSPIKSRPANDGNDCFSAADSENQAVDPELGCCLVECQTGKIISSDDRFTEWTELTLGTCGPVQIASILPDYHQFKCDEKQPSYVESCATGPKCVSLPVLVELVELKGDQHSSTLLRFYSEGSSQENGSADSLTGLPDRTALANFISRLSMQVPFVPFALLFLDLDQFKKVNDEYGHLAGDQVLVETTRRWNEVLRTSDFACRYGGDEFVIVLAEMFTGKNISQVIQRLKAVTTKPFEIENLQVSIAVSVGFTLVENPKIDLSELVKLADRDMYNCKHQSDQ